VYGRGIAPPDPSGSGDATVGGDAARLGAGRLAATSPAGVAVAAGLEHAAVADMISAMAGAIRKMNDLGILVSLKWVVTH
jgi:hypothetical protein